MTGFGHGIYICWHLPGYSDCEDFILYEDDGISLDFPDGKHNRAILSYTTEQGGTVDRQGNYAGRRYSVVDWRPI